RAIVRSMGLARTRSPGGDEALMSVWAEWLGQTSRPQLSRMPRSYEKTAAAPAAGRDHCRPRRSAATGTLTVEHEHAGHGWDRVFGPHSLTHVTRTTRRG